MTTAMTIAFLYFMLWLFGRADLLGERPEERSRRELPPRPAPSADGQLSQRLAAASADQLAPIDDDRRHGAEAMRSRLPHPYLTGSLASRRWRAGGCLRNRPEPSSDLAAAVNVLDGVPRLVDQLVSGGC